MKLLIYPLIIVLSLGFSFSLYRNLKQYNQLKEQDKYKVLAKDLLNDDISELQFMAESMFADKYGFENFLDSLNQCYDILRVSLKTGCINNDKNDNYIDQFIHTTFSDKLDIIDKDPCFIHSDIPCDSVFNLDCLEKISYLKELLTPTWYSRRYLFADFDIWERKNIDLSDKDSTILQIRLLKNNNDLMHNIELVEYDNFKVMNPYLGELTVFKNDYLNNVEQRITFPIYDWIENDTFMQEVVFEQEK